MGSNCSTDYTIDVYPVNPWSCSSNVNLCPTSTVNMCLHIRSHVEAIDDTDAFKVMLFGHLCKYKIRLENKT